MKSLSSVIPPRVLAFFGMGMVLPFLLNNNIYFRVAETLVFIFLAGFQRRRLKLLPGLIALISVTFVHLLQPFGKVLLKAGVLEITQGALSLGIYKSCMLIGLFYLSKCFISPHLRLPGYIGRIFGLSLYFFGAMSSDQKTILSKKPVESLDQILVSQQQMVIPRESSCKKINLDKSSLPGLVVCASLLILLWLVLILQNS